MYFCLWVIGILKCKTSADNKELIIQAAKYFNKAG